MVDVSEWLPDEEHPFFPEGSRDKQLFRCPDPAPNPQLIAGHRYLFKKSRAVYPDQFWAEVVAHRIGLLTGVPVPPAYPAWDSRSGDCAALIEWFYGRPGAEWEGFLSGGLFMKASIRDYDLKRGKQHNFQHIEAWCAVLAASSALTRGAVGLNGDWILDWARMLCFDALTGNTDRHHENWGFLISRSLTPANVRFHLAPAFDNGTSLGHERPADQFGRFDDAAYMARYIGNGHHHMKWHAGDERQAGHAELLLKLLEKHPQCRPAMLAVLRFDAAALELSLSALARLRLPVPLSTERARFMLRLVLARRDHLMNALTSP